MEILLFIIGLLVIGWFERDKTADLAKAMEELSHRPEELEKLDTFRAMKKAYMSSYKWREKRECALAAAHYRCTTCKSKHGLQVHHIRYNLVPREPVADLRVLCEVCHLELHLEHGFPTTYKEYMEWNH